MTRYPCPCCGYRVFPAPPGSAERCPICGWQDDLRQLRYALFNGPPNRISLIDAQMNYALLGAKDAAALHSVRFPAPGDARDPDWRAIDLDVDNPQDVPLETTIAEPVQDATRLYYWTPAYWQNAR